MKKCSRCGRNLPVHSFGPYKQGRDGLRPECRGCCYQRKQYRLLKSKSIQYIRFVIVKPFNTVFLSKTCITCKSLKELCHFAKRGDSRDGTVSECKSCKNAKINRADKREMDRQYYISNKDKVIQSVREYRRNNTYKINKLSSFHRAKKIMATPKWLNKDQLSQIESKYKEARELTVTTGTRYHVDHIVPLVNSKVCGLHVPWNLRVIPAFDNLSKSNKLISEVLNVV